MSLSVLDDTPITYVATGDGSKVVLRDSVDDQIRLPSIDGNMFSSLAVPDGLTLAVPFPDWSTAAPAVLNVYRAFGLVVVKVEMRSMILHFSTKEGGGPIRSPANYSPSRGLRII